MKDTEGTGWLILIMALLLVTYPASTLNLSGTAGSSEQGKGATKEELAPVQQQPKYSDVRPASPKSLGELLNDFLEIDNYGSCTGWPEGDPRRDLTIEFLVATLSDPIDTRFDYVFDRSLGAIQRAVESAKYVLDRFYLPWLEPEPERSTLRRFARLPGILLFRSRESPTLLAVLVVGESPTNGIHKEAFQSALSEIAGLEGWVSGQRKRGQDCWPKPISSQPDIRRVRVLGPSFSGSAKSLEFAIWNWLSNNLNNPIDFQIVSGSATAIPRYQDNSYRIGLHRFRSTLISDEIAQRCFLEDYLRKEHGVPLKKVAILVEANTSYGQASLVRKDVVRIPFPLHIARLRREAGRSRQEIVAQLDTAKTPPITHLPQAAKDAARDIIPPLSELQTSALEPLMGNILKTINLERVCYVGIIASDVQDVIFLAREVRSHCSNTVVFTFNSDMLYLHPEVNPDLYGMLMVTTYPLFSINRTRTYPFSASTGRLQFTSDIEQGMYNATLALLGVEDGMLEYAPPLRYADGKERKPPLWVTAVGHDSLHPIRLFDGGEGNEGYVFGAKYGKADPDKMDVECGLTSGYGRMTFLVWCIGSLVLVYFLLKAFPLLRVALRGTRDADGKQQATAHSQTGEDEHEKKIQQDDHPTAGFLSNMKRQLLSLFGEAKWGGQNPVRQLYMFGSFISLLLFHMLMTAVWLMRELASKHLSDPGYAGIYNQSSGGEFLTRLLLFAVLAVYVIIIVIVAVSIYRSRRNPIGREGLLSIVFVLMSCIGGLVIAGALSLSWIRMSSNPALAYYLYARATAIDSGLSPLFPLLFVALASFSCTFSVLRRFRLLEEEVEDSAFSCETRNIDASLKRPPPSFSGIETMKSRLRSLLSLQPSALPGARAAVVILMIPCGMIFVDSLSLSLECKPFVYFFMLSFVVVYLGLTMEFFRLILVYRDLRKLLQHLSWHPMGGAYRGLRGAQPAIPKLTLTRLSSPYAAVDFALKHAVLFVNRLHMLTGGKNKEMFEGALRAPDLSQDVAEAQQALTHALASDATGDFERGISYRREARAILLRFARRLECLLESQWFVRVTSTGNQESGQDSEGNEEASQAEKRLRAISEQSLAQLGENFLAAHSVSFVHFVIAHLKNLASCIIGGLLLMLMAITVYAFQPREVLLLFNWTVVLAAVTVIIAVSVQLDRDWVLSELSGTTPGRVAWDREFLWRIVIFGILPILGLLGAQFPSSIRRILSLLGPHAGGTI